MKKWICPERNCRQSFKRRQHLIRHQDNTHTQSRPHSCSICNRSFARHDALIRHIRFHSQESNLRGLERALSACVRCHSRKIRCDNETPCLPCQKYNADCKRLATPEFLRNGASSVSADNDGEVSRLSNDPERGDYYTALPSNHHLQSETSPPESHPAFSQETLPLITDYRQFSESNISISQQADTSPLSRPGSSEPDHHGGGLEFAKGSDRLFQSIRYMSLATIIDQEEPLGLNSPAMADSILETSSVSAKSMQSTQVIPSASASTTSYFSFPSEGPPPSQYFSYLDDEETALAFAEHRDTIQSILHDASIDRYFRLFHPQWPVLHQEMFQQDPRQLELLFSVALLGSLLEENLTKLDALKALHKAISWRLEAKVRQQYEESNIDTTGESQLLLAQALLLNILFAVYLQEEPLLSTACWQMGNLVSWVRHIGFFHMEHIAAEDNSSATEWSRWILREHKMRVAFATFRLECQLNFIHDLPPIMRFQEIEIPFISTDAAWNTSTVREWEQAMLQEPPSRTDASFSALCSLAHSPLSPSKRLLLPGFFTAEDFELGMCAMQSRLWEETKQYQIASRSILDECELESSEIANLHGYGVSWPVLLEIWRVTIEQFLLSSHGHSSALGKQTSLLTGMLLYHASMLRAYADVSFLRRLATSLNSTEREGHQLPPFLHQHEMRVEQWTRSNFARDALWHAAQILHLAIQQIYHLRAQNILLNPVVTECLFRATLIAWALCRFRFTCSLCAPLSSMAHGEFLLNDKCPKPGAKRNSNDTTDAGERGVELTLLEKHSEQYNQWLKKEDGRTYIENTLVCACNMPDLVDRYIQVIRVSSADHQKANVTTYVGILDNLKRIR